MKVVVAMDSFKGSLTSLEAGAAVSAGIHKVVPNAKVVVRPLADGGEGTVRALVEGMNGRLEKVWVTGPLGTPVEAEYGRIEESNTAIIEMSAAAGITLVCERERNPLNTTTFGVGELILDAIKKGCRHFMVGIGGSATNDGGVGMLQALGYEFLDCQNKQVPYGAKGLAMIEKISDCHVIPELKDCTFRIACDVTNPLCGEQGCSAVFGPQKGATLSMIAKMDQWLANYAKLTQEKYPKADRNEPGTGAAGGLGFAFLSYTNARLESGIKIVLEETKLESFLKDADLVITGEGRLDVQTVMGKAPAGVAEIAKRHKKKVIAFSGCVTEDAAVCNQYGIDAFFPILRTVSSLDEALNPKNAYQNMAATVEQVFRLIKCMED
ncbi:glycerate kinase family protein [Roseburia sp. 831b]|uniref:glycerate kinase family protein n=1 Tax=Roseburia sp. 831b TaxID=1261635 RepID=UPI000950C1C1|nr:glycerate kinase [Roseburia sp. 831b]WVK74541.1 glycerate kinase [Roseburia sp. 831b]